MEFDFSFLGSLADFVKTGNLSSLSLKFISGERQDPEKYLPYTLEFQVCLLVFKYD